MEYKHVISSRFFIVILVVLLALLTNVKYKQYKGQRDVEKLKSDLRNQAGIHEQKNKELAESIAYLNSESFKEQAARQQLNLKKEGEIVYSFSDPSQEFVEQKTNEVRASNSQQWWNYFFNQKQ